MRVLLVDDHALFLEGLQNLLTARGVKVVGMARDGLDALDKARALTPDIILMDIRMPRCDGLAATRLIRAEIPESRIVMLTTSTQEGDLFEAIKSGACGYLLKNLEAGPFISYLEGVMRGEAAISRELASAVLHEFGRMAEEARGRGEAETREMGGKELTARQLEVLQMVARGLPYKEVANTLGLSEHTVKYHMGDILRRLHLKNREQVVAYAVRNGLVKKGE